MSRRKYVVAGYFLEHFTGKLPQEVADNITEVADNITNAIHDIGDCDVIVISHKLATKINIPKLVRYYSEEYMDKK
jgi:hypothetical protein